MKRFAIALLLLVSLDASANYSMDPQRKPDPAFAKFFVNRIDKWLRLNIFDYRTKLSAADVEFVDSYLSDPRTLGEMKGAGFIRGYSYGFKAESGRVTYGPFRFVRPTPTAADREAFSKVLKARGVPSSSDVIGIGYTSNPDEIEVITQGAGSTTEIALYRKGKLESASKVERGVEAPMRCPVSPMNEQVDRVTTGKDVHFAYHSSLIEDEALSMDGRKLVHKIQLGLELSPGLVDYHSQVHYGLAYP